MTVPVLRPERRGWNERYNWIVAVVAMVVAFFLILLYQRSWLPALFSDLLSQGLPGTGEEAARVYALTTLAFALPGVAVILATLLWQFLPSRASRILILVVASVWFIAVSPAGLGRASGISAAGLVQKMLVRAGADPGVAELWADAIYAGALLGAVLGIAAGVFALMRTVATSSRRRAAKKR